MLKNAIFETSVFSKDKILQTDKKQIVLVGKSNVGKSSFINALANQKKLAFVGNKPGKTKCINYYNINRDFYIVDLPGYGFSKMSISEKENTNALIDHYIDNNENIAHVFLILDIRHDPTKDDIIMYEYLLEKNIDFTIIANKADKINKSQVEKHINNIQNILEYKDQVIPFSSESKLNIESVIDTIKKYV